ncbi:hypothetical protein ACRALDRAFT_2058148 [Sodiomyces alcalophilus JCM 7366]|uniref:uncharacterized protein n=1 Tax=Sodiomyces alcalophilus JCM 7366 TaxID=591952 RepID=UPI0039B5BD87
MSPAGIWRPTPTVYAPRGAGPGEPHMNTYGAVSVSMVNADGVSPPSSPELSPGDGQSFDEDDISPIDETPDISQLDIAQRHYRLYMEAQERQDVEQREKRYRAMLQERQRERALDSDEHQKASRTPKPQRPDQATPPRQRSNIPLLRRERRRNQDTTKTRRPSETGDSNSESPGRAGLDLGHPSELSHHTPPKHQQQRPRVFSDRIRDTTVRPGAAASRSPAPRSPAPRSPASTGTSPLSSIENRPGWRGASGRTAIVEPVRDNPVVAPLSIPRKSSKRTAAATKAKAWPATATTTTTTTTPTPNRSSHSPLDRTSTPLSPASPSDSETSMATTAPTQTIRTMIPEMLRHRNRKQLPSSTPTSSTTSTPHASGNGLDQPPVHPTMVVDPASPQSRAGSNDKALRRKPPPPNSSAISSQHRHAPQESVSSSVYSVHPSPPAADRERHHEPDHEPDTWAQPASRFSYTTYATSTNTGSPRDSIDSDLPPMPVQVVESVMDRKRPVPSGDGHLASGANDAPVVITMGSPFTTGRPSGKKATTTTTSSSSSPSPPPTVTVTVTPTATPPATDGDRRQSRLSLSKALPPAPPELLSVNDRVAHLNARLQALGNRRININVAIKQMTEMMPTDNLLASDEVLRKRELEKRKVEAFKDELADVQREEYEIGLKLHRAYKRMDRSAEYEPTTLWVRRITG